MARNWFSNFRPFAKPLVYQGLSFQTPEHFFQAMKAPKNDLATRRRVAEALTPAEAKGMGRNIRLRPDWEQVKADVMRFAQRHRFSDPEWRRQLLGTEGEIVEWNTWHDRIWGKCACPRCKGEGKNLLGEILMEIRGEVRQEQENSAKRLPPPLPKLSKGGYGSFGSSPG